MATVEAPTPIAPFPPAPKLGKALPTRRRSDKASSGEFAIEDGPIELSVVGQNCAAADGCTNLCSDLRPCRGTRKLDRSNAVHSRGLGRDLGPGINQSVEDRQARPGTDDRDLDTETIQIRRFGIENHRIGPQKSSRLASSKFSLSVPTYAVKRMQPHGDSPTQGYDIFSRQKRNITVRMKITIRPSNRCVVEKG